MQLLASVFKIAKTTDSANEMSRYFRSFQKTAVTATLKRGKKKCPESFPVGFSVGDHSQATSTLISIITKAG